MRGSRFGMGVHIEARRLYWAGMNVVNIASALGCHRDSIRNWVKQLPWKPRKRSALRLSYAEREEILVGLQKGSHSAALH